MSEEDLQNEAVETQEEPTQDVARPDYVPEEYWANGQVDIKKMTDDLAMDKKRIDDLRRIISQPKKQEHYDKLFEDRELNDYQKEDMSFYVQLANKNGLSKKQAEQLYDDYSAALQERYQKQVEEYNKQLEEEKKAFGPEYQNVVDGLNSFGQNKVKSGEWTEQMQKDFYGMPMNANQLRILSQLVANQPRLNLSGGNSQSNDGDSLTKELYNLSSTYHKMVKMGRGDEPAVQEMRNRLHKLQGEYNRMIDLQGVSNEF